jgi:organic radical activating enzyme
VPSGFVSVKAVVAELDDYLARQPILDFITFAGSGEPTLHQGLGIIIEHIKHKHPGYKVAVLTNGTLFARPDIRQAVLMADLLVPSLDGATAVSFGTINRPDPSLDVNGVIEGLVALRKEYRGTFVLEVFVVPGINDSTEEVAALREAALRINPDAIQLNRLDRPGILPWVTQASDELLAAIHEGLLPLTVFEVARRQAGEVRRMDDSYVDHAILTRLAERAFDTTTLAFLIGLHEGLVAKHVNQLLADGRLKRVLPEDEPPAGSPRRLIVQAA